MITFIHTPKTPKRPVVDEYHGVQVVDDYRWLEDADDPDVRTWWVVRNERTRAALAALPEQQDIHRRVKALFEAASPDYYFMSYRGGRLFALKDQPPKSQPMLVTLASADDLASERVVLDPNMLNPDGTTAIDWYVPSNDGKLVAVSLSEKGSEDGSLYVYDVETGKALGDVIPRVQYPTGGGSTAWRADGSGFYYTRYPHAGERSPEDLNFYQQVFFHQLGTSVSEDTYCIGREFPRIAEIHLEASKDGQHLLAVVANGDGGEYAHYLLSSDGTWRQLTRFEDRITQAKFGSDGDLYLLSLAGAPRGKLLRLRLNDERNIALANAAVVVPEADTAIMGFEPAESLLYVSRLDGGPMTVNVFDQAGRNQGALPMPPVSSVRQMLHTTGDAILLQVSSFTKPPAWYAFDPHDEELRPTALRVTSLAEADFSDAEVVRDFAVSKDGTRVPVNIIKRKGLQLDGGNPTVLYGYGGYGINLTPGFWERLAVWLEKGGVYVIANLRGGGEYGDDWHKAGNLTNKQNVFDDFIACAEFLISTGYTRPDKLAIEGGSNGGLLVGAALTQRPDLFRAAVAHVGIFDMLRVELDPNGAFNVTEFGTVKDEAQFKALYAYSPYHRVVDGAAYPAVMLLTGENDGRVNPYHSRKMTARLQAATSSGRPVLLRTSSAGHGQGSSLQEIIEQETDVFAFLMDQLAVSPSPSPSLPASRSSRRSES